MKRKLITLVVLLLTATLLLQACSSIEDIAGQLTPNNNGSNQIGGNVAPNEDNADADQKDPAVSLGRFNGGKYTNNYVGYSCTLDENWEIFTAEELQELPDAVKDALAGSDLGDAVQDMPQIADMMAQNVTDLLSINILYQKLSLLDRARYAKMSEDAIAEEYLSQKELIAESYQQAGITILKMEKKQVTFLGEPRVAVLTSAQTQGMDYYTLQIFDFNLGSFGVVTTFGSYVENNTEDMLSLFSPIN